MPAYQARKAARAGVPGKLSWGNADAGNCFGLTSMATFHLLKFRQMRSMTS